MPAQQLRPPDASAAAAKNHETRQQEVRHNANALGHASLLYFIGEIVDTASNRHQEKNFIANTLGHVALRYFIGEAIDSRNHVA